MPNLVHLLQTQDPGYVRIVAELWGIALASNEVQSAADEAAAAMLEPQLAGEIVDTLDESARTALTAVVRAGGQMPWAAFMRQFGDIREMGVGRRDREQPHLHPNSPAEVLFYRGLLGRAFFDSEKGPQEFAYIPEDMLQRLRGRAHAPRSPAALPGRAAAAAERRVERAATDRILDDATTLLAALRMDHPAPADPVLGGLLESAGILQHGAPQARQVKAFLEMPRSEAIGLLAQAWRGSDSFNELRLLPGLICEGPWANLPRPTRQFILGELDRIPPGKWWSMRAFLNDIKRERADFQRPAGDYDSWFIKSAADGSYLRGFSSWDQVDGALIRFVIVDVMHRLGLVAVACPAEDEQPAAFRLPDVRAPIGTIKEGGKMHIGSQGRITVPRLVPRAVRYQLARFCEWDEEKADGFRYHVTPASLTRAREQGLRVEQLISVLVKHAEAGIPPVLVKALKRWETSGTEARVLTRAVLKVSKPEILVALRKSKAAKYLGEALGPTTVIVKDGAVEKVAQAMTELGLLLEDSTNPPA